MLNRIIAFSIENKAIVGLLTAAIIGYGVYSALQIPLDAVPDITTNQVQVITQAPNLGAEDIEQFVTYPVELGLANLPGVVEIRSISRFGLSVVTVIFDEDMDTYLPRQLVAEKLTEVRNSIPPGFGEPTMGPITTGLGEIYQYTLEVESAYRDSFSLTELRSIQDWLVRRQMAMVPGVIEINGFGGYIKQYEVAIDPNRLRSMDLSIQDIYHALERNNQNTGGAYIEKNHMANFIRSDGLVGDLDDIRQIVVAHRKGFPIQIEDVATVQFGTAVRYGAFTKDGQGEAVGGMIMMLKGANSYEVVQRVVERMNKIEASLPKGVHIQPFLNRAELIDRTTSTIGSNLVEGALIVIFVLVFLLGNWRGGLIVASVIPLSLLFAFILMHHFDVWANLMSLGAIDFGIIVDGAVIIVEASVFYMSRQVLNNSQLKASDRDEKAKYAAGKMMGSAFFGQLIILIVFVPILALEGVEGKMFRPMALTFMFAMIGVMLLCLTYVPMMSAWLLRPNVGSRTWGDRVVGWFEKHYVRLLRRVLKRGGLVIAVAVVLLGLAGWQFSRMGGEFIPQLDEGDLALHIMVRPGSSLSEAIKATTAVEGILVNEFPEVVHAMSRIGVAEVPTDPMPMELADCIVTLKPQEEWTSAKTQAELIEKMKARLDDVPGTSYIFTQPIEMRFNELISGVREDVAVKLFGEDLGVLASKAEAIERIARTVEGVADIKVEATQGLPQMTVQYQRNKLAQYGLNISALNQLVSSAFAGGHAGVVFEGERRFDLVVRLDSAHRTRIEDLQTLYVPTPDGAQVMLQEVATIDFKPGPMQISRENTNRRTYVGLNVRGRDVQSVVEELQAKLNTQLDLPPGYYIRYGGTFENLQRASQRLLIVVPAALVMIFILIYLALRDFRQALMIYLAIPMASIGGVFMLWLREMPFSISAGIGFIVLFGVAVLNGLVLIESWNSLKADGMPLKDRITEGAKRRIRPIMLTALTDIFGFLPMAVSTSAGAEVQQPLATVVIGGMLSATLLTLIILPVLYRWNENLSLGKVRQALPMLLLPVILIGANWPTDAAAQSPSKVTTAEQAVEVGLAHNLSLSAQRQEVNAIGTQRKAAFNPQRLQLNMQYGNYDSYNEDFAFNIQQTFELPMAYTARRDLAEARITGAELAVEVQANALRFQIRAAWYELATLHQKRRILRTQDSIYTEFARAARIRVETQAARYLEQVSAETQLAELQNQLRQNAAEITIAELQLKQLISDTSAIAFVPEPLLPPADLLTFDSAAVASHPLIRQAQQHAEQAQQRRKLAQAQLYPRLNLGYNNQSLIGNSKPDGSTTDMSDRFHSVLAGVQIPLFFGQYRAKIEQAKIEQEIANTRADYRQLTQQMQLERQLQTLDNARRSVAYFTQTALAQANELRRFANLSYAEQEIGYIEYAQNLNQALQIERDYLKALHQYYHARAAARYLIGQ